MNIMDLFLIAVIVAIYTWILGGYIEEKMKDMETRLNKKLDAIGSEIWWRNRSNL